MKIEFYSIPNCIHAEAFKIFFNKNNLPFRELTVNNETARQELLKLTKQDKISDLKLTFSHSIPVLIGFDEHYLNLLEHIKEYKPKIET